VRLRVVLVALAAIGVAGAGTASGVPRWRLLAQDRSSSPPGPPGLTAVTAETSVPIVSAAHRHSLRIRVVATPASLRPYVSWHVACLSGHASYEGDGFHRASFTKTIESAPGCSADVTATLYFWAAASGVTVRIYGR
jgi:hypothetical protein